MQRMLQRHAHAAQELMVIVADPTRRLLRVEQRHRGICGLARGCGAHGQPIGAVRENLRLCQPVAHGLERRQRTAELLALGHISHRAGQGSSQQSGRLRRHGHPPCARDLRWVGGMQGHRLGHVGKERDRIGVERILLRRRNLLLASGEAAHAGRADNDHGGTGPEEAHRRAGPSFFQQADRPRQVGIDQRTDERRKRRLHCERQARQFLDHEGRRHRAEFFHGLDIEKAILHQRGIKLGAFQCQSGIVQGGGCERPSQYLDEIEHLPLVFIEGKLHQRGSRGSSSTSLAMMLSWISAEPAAIPATIPR